MIENVAAITVQIPTDVKRKLEYMGRVTGNRKLASYLRTVFLKLTEDIELPGPGEYFPMEAFEIPEVKEKIQRNTVRLVTDFTEAVKEIRDRDFSSEINPEALRPNENTKWMKEFINNNQNQKP